MRNVSLLISSVVAVNANLIADKQQNGTHGDGIEQALASDAEIKHLKVNL